MSKADEHPRAPGLGLPERPTAVGTTTAAPANRIRRHRRKDPAVRGRVPVEDADVVLVRRPRRARRHGCGPVVGRSLLKRQRLAAETLQERGRLRVLHRVAVLVEDHVSVLRVVDTAGPVFDGTPRLEERVVPAKGVRDHTLGAIVDAIAGRVAEPEIVDVLLRAVDVVIGHQGIEDGVRALHSPPGQGSLADLVTPVATELCPHPSPPQAALATPYVPEIDRPAQPREEARIATVMVRSQASEASILDNGIRVIELRVAGAKASDEALRSKHLARGGVDEHLELSARVDAGNDDAPDQTAALAGLDRQVGR